MNAPLTVVAIPRHRAAAPKSKRRPHTPLSAIDPLGIAAVRAAGRVPDIPGRRPGKPVTFDSAL
ncbi:hypothetical protein [Streptomyces sp. NBC_00568]|uniref:hypothetical protein n=1 Tax=Streptomyces sp. NBC_00568 TaxID=2975779 RepID=UPI002250258F|nr:hypothetical protein [Streptomyces sp. NBC_00568]MCX4993438.1 hypothetical protein [Streptomyces sp. NBC_00568]